MSKEEPHVYADELVKLEVTVRFLYFLKDIGIRSACDQAGQKWQYYVYIISEMSG